MKWPSVTGVVVYARFATWLSYKESLFNLVEFVALHCLPSLVLIAYFARRSNNDFQNAVYYHKPYAGRCHRPTALELGLGSL